MLFSYNCTPENEHNSARNTYRNVINVLNKEFVHQVGKKNYHYIRIQGQQNVKIYNVDMYCHITQRNCVGL